jgi:hypothetical protein
MAKAGDDNSANASSWPGFLSELTKSFLILRDIFGYALPGAVFLSIGLLCRRFSLHDVEYFLRPYQLPAWLAAVLGLGACYTAGHLMAQIAYFPYNEWKFPFRKQAVTYTTGQLAAQIARFPYNLWKFIFRKRAVAEGKKSGGGSQLEDCGQTQVPVELILLRGSHPELLIELDRQSIMSQLRGGTGAAMLMGFFIFYIFPTPPLGWMMGVAGAFLLIVFWWSAGPHLRGLREHTAAAGRQALASNQAEKPSGDHNKKQAV